MFARHKAQAVMRSLTTNLKRAGEVPYVGKSSVERVYICGAGPSMQASERVLSEQLNSPKVEVWAVNASAPIVPWADCVVVRESIDVSAQLEATSCKRALLDICANPKIWDTATEDALSCEWFIPASVQNFALCKLLGVTPTYAGPSAVTAAVALAHQRGAREIVLVGVDLAFVDGQGYAKGSAWGDIRGAMGDDGLMHMSGMEAMRFAVSESGQNAPPTAQRVETWPSVHGGEVQSLATWGDQVRWLAQFAERHPILTLVNASKGVAIPGWMPRDLEEMLVDRKFPGEYVDTQPAIDAILADAKHALEVQGGGASPRLTTGVIEAMSAGGILEARDAARGNPEAAIKGTWAAYAASGEWVLGELQE